MPFILRVDVDKPYGSSNLIQRVASKLVEDFWFPIIPKMGYLHTMYTFLDFCRDKGVCGTFYHRNCTIPTNDILDRLTGEGHKVGFHAESTRNIETFKVELQKFRKQVSKTDVSSFSKHGSGVHKLGKNHYAPYEPEKYKLWAHELGIKYPTGNGILDGIEPKIQDEDLFYPNIFWIEREYRGTVIKSIDDILKIAESNIVPILIHPTNFCSTPQVRDDFAYLISESRSKGIDWLSPF